MTVRQAARSRDVLSALLRRTTDPSDRPAVARLAHALGDPAIVARRLAPALAAIAGDKVAEPGLAGVDRDGLRGVLLYRDARLTAIVAVVDGNRPPPATIRFGSDAVLTVFHAREPATIECYRSETGSGGRDRFCADRAPPCRATGRRTISVGDWVMCASDHETMRIVASAGPVPLVRVAWHIASPLPARLYRWPGGDVCGMTMASEADARARMMVSALRALERPDAADAFAHVARSAPFTLRWHAMRTWLASDAKGALRALDAMARCDVHPEVRRAATAALGLARSYAA